MSFIDQVKSILNLNKPDYVSAEFQVIKPPRKMERKMYGPKLEEFAPEPYREAFKKYWGVDIPMAITIMRKENASFNPKARNVNRDGSVDLGLFQINDKHTFEPYMRNRPEIMRQIGITRFEDLEDPVKNIAFARALAEARGNYSAWYALDEDERAKKLNAKRHFFQN